MLLRNAWSWRLCALACEGQAVRSLPWHLGRGSVSGTVEPRTNACVGLARQARSMCSASSEVDGDTDVVIALGSNQGNRAKALTCALQELTLNGVQVLCSSNLYETSPAYMVDQPKFLNAAVLARTRRCPQDLLKLLKLMEEQAGRNLQVAVPNGPRPLDLDIIFYGNKKYQDDQLQIPHPRWQERPFVTVPVADLHHPSMLSARPLDALGCGGGSSSDSSSAGGGNSGGDVLRQVVPLRCGRRLLEFGQRTMVMGILNVTPDSFSDGGKYISTPQAVAHAKALLADGADILDIGGQSTRPGSMRLSAQEEMDRVLPVIQALRASEGLASCAIVSIDTYYADVAREAVLAGADIVNDVSGGKMDDRMFGQVAELQVPYVLMHMRGNMDTMQQFTQYTDVCQEVAKELQHSIQHAMQAGIPAWSLILDPGCGFSKSANGNVQLIRNLDKLRGYLPGGMQKLPLLVGLSRKGFLSKLTGRSPNVERDSATVAACTICVAKGADIVRVHNVQAVTDGMKVTDALWRRSDPQQR